MTNLMEALAEAKRSIDFPRHAALHAASEAEINRLRAENARLRKLAQAMVDSCLHVEDPWVSPPFRSAISALRAALNEGGGE